ncbi:MAG: hypothetical protein LBU32_01285 [Clostridiales bacterium]|nr:hypothetical protein [Clostridiales bacterium]
MTPRVSDTEFYLQRPDGALMWNFDYWVANYADANFPPELFYDMPMINGRKVYWQGSFNYDNAEQNNMNCTVRPLINGTFKFKLYFEDISPDELERLIFCLNLYGQGRHRIGKGKPIGMGIVKIDANTVTLRKYVIQAGNVAVNDTPYIPSGQLPKAIKDDDGNLIDTAAQILEYTTPLTDNERDAVHYPRLNAGGKIFEWFGKNRGSVNTPTIRNTIPIIGGGRKTLPNDPILT